MLFKEAAEDYIKYVKVTKSKGTYNFNKNKLRTLLVFFEGVDCKNITKSAIIDFIIWLRERNEMISNTTINKYVQLIKRILKNECNTQIHFDKLPETKTMIQVIPVNDIKKIFTYLDNDTYPEHLRNLVMFRLLLDTGLRISELLSLKVENFNFETRTILVTETKTNVHRYVFFTAKTHSYLSKYIFQSRIKDNLFINLNTREVMKIDRVQKICQNLQRQCNIKNSISPHKWRHTFATRFSERNGNMEVLRKILGHNSLLTTQKYLHVGSDKLKIEYERIVG